MHDSSQRRCFPQEPQCACFFPLSTTGTQDEQTGRRHLPLQEFYRQHFTVCPEFHSSRACTLYLLVLVGSDRSEDSLREAEHLEDAPADTEQIVCLHDVEARLVTVHGVQDDLGHTKDKVSMCHPCQHTAGSLWTLPGHPFLTRTSLAGS